MLQNKTAAVWFCSILNTKACKNGKRIHLSLVWIYLANNNCKSTIVSYGNEKKMLIKQNLEKHSNTWKFLHTEFKTNFGLEPYLMWVVIFEFGKEWE